METPISSVERIDTDHSHRLRFIIGTQTLVLTGTWHFEEEDAHPETIDLSDPKIDLNYLVCVQGANYLIYPPDIEKVQRTLRILQTGRSADYHFHVVAPGKVVKLLHGFGSLQTGKERETPGMKSEAADKEFASAQKLKAVNMMMEAVCNTSVNIIHVFSCVYNDKDELVDLEWRYLNKTAANYYRRKDLQHKRLLEEFPAYKTSRIWQRYVDVVKTRKEACFEHHDTYATTDNWFQLTVAALQDGIVVNGLNISQRKLNEIALKENKHFIQNIADSTPALIYVLNVPEHKVIYVNGRTKQLLGLSENDVYDMKHSIFERVLHPDDVARSIQRIENFATLSDGEIREMEVRIKIEGDGWRWFRVRDKLFKRRDDGTVWQTIGVAVDISDRKLREENEHLQRQIDLQAERIAAIGNWQWNLRTGQWTWGINLYRLLELDQENTRPSLAVFLASIHPDDRDFMRKESEQMKQSPEGPLPMTAFRVIKKDGSIRYLREAIEVINLHDDRMAIGVVRDVTSDVLTQRTLIERIRFSETLIEASIDRIFVLDTDLRFVLWNKSAERATNVKRETVLGKPLDEVFPTVANNSRIQENLRDALKGKSVYVPLEEGAYSQGFFEVYYIPLRGAGNEIYGILNIVHDITERIRAEHELQRLNTSLQQKNNALQNINAELSAFAFVASHDLREPLRKICIFSESLARSQKGEMSPHGKEYLKRILSCAARMNELMDEMLTLSRTNVSRLSVESFNMNEVLKIVLTEMRDVIDEKKAQVVCNELPVFNGNRHQFIQLFQNLIGNALKFQRDGNIPHVKISGELVEGTTLNHSAVLPHKKYLRLEVADNGIGFDEEYAGKIFQMFQRLHAVNEFPGTGMGLAVCKKIVDNHNGFIVTKSTPGTGSAFICYFPIQ